MKPEKVSPTVLTWFLKSLLPIKLQEMPRDRCEVPADVCSIRTDTFAREPTLYGQGSSNEIFTYV